MNETSETMLERPCRVCDGRRMLVPVTNDLTGRQLRDVERRPVFEIVCDGCGRKERRRPGDG